MAWPTSDRPTEKVITEIMCVFHCVVSLKCQINRQTGARLIVLTFLGDFRSSKGKPSSHY